MHRSMARVGRPWTKENHGGKCKCTLEKECESILPLLNGDAQECVAGVEERSCEELERKKKESNNAWFQANKTKSGINKTVKHSNKQT